MPASFESLETRRMLARSLPVLAPIPMTHVPAAIHQQFPTPVEIGQSESVRPAALNQPSQPDMLAASDHGFFNNDDITNETSPTITGTATPLTSIEVLVNDIVISTVTTNENGAWTTTLNNLASGVNTITARETDGLGSYSPLSDPLNISIDIIKPAMLSSAFFWQNSPHLLRMNFSETITPTIGPSSLVATNLTQQVTLLPAQLSAFFSTLTNVLNVGFPGLTNQIVTDGNWKITLDKNLVTDRAGNNLEADAVAEFFFLTGDANRDRRVDGADLDILVGHLNQFGASFADGDFNFDQTVDLADADILMSKWMSELPPILPKFSPVNLTASNNRAQQREPLATKLGHINPPTVRVTRKVKRVR